MPRSSQARLIAAATAGAWWNQLTYSVERPAGDALVPGVRLRVPVGASERVAVFIGAGEQFEGEVKPISSVIDDYPAMSRGTMALLRWFCDAFLCGMGTAVKTLLPARFFSGAPVEGEPAPQNDHPRTDGDEVDLIYDPRDSRRLERYAELISDGAPTLICCPTRSDASRLFAGLKAAGALPDDAMLYPRSAPAAEWRAWCRALRGEASVVIGAQASALTPVAGLARLIVEDESTPVWRTMRPPIFNVRSLIAMRARAEGCSLVLGGRMPSSRAFARIEHRAEELAPALEPRCERRSFFVDLREAYSPAVKGVEGRVAISEPLVRETQRALASGQWAIWVLDRKGAAAEIRCEECGTVLSCASCGGVMRWEAGRARVRCVVCGADGAVPDECPTCRGRMLVARRPGVESVVPLARYALPSGTPVLLYGDDAGGSKGAARASEIEQHGPGVIVGTRAALEELTRLRVGLVGWLDADCEAARDEYDARARAFILMWESAWRGADPERRAVLLQTRRPMTGWQSGLSDDRLGWRTFWRRELDERRELSMPPFTALIRVELDASDSELITAELDARACEYWDEETERSGRPGRAIWIRTKRTSEIKKILAPLFHISQAKKGFPSVAVWHD